MTITAIKVTDLSFNQEEAQQLLTAMVAKLGDEWVIKELADLSLKGGRRALCDALLKARVEALCDGHN